VLSELHYNSCVVGRKGHERVVLCTSRQGMSRSVPEGDLNSRMVQPNPLRS